MKKWIALLLAASMLLSLAACGGASAPAQTTGATEPATQATEAPTEAPTEPPVVYTPYELSEGETYMDAVQAMGFWELDMDLCAQEAKMFGWEGAKKAAATPVCLEVTETGFHMEVDYVGGVSFNNPENPLASSMKVASAGIVDVYAAKADGLANLAGIDPEDYQYEMDFTFSDEQAWGNLLHCYEYFYYDLDDEGNSCNAAYVFLYYYPTTGNLYNVVFRQPEGTYMTCIPALLPMDADSIPFHPQAQTLTYGDFTFEMSQFAIQCGDTRYFYDYRPGMSLSAWACSELNTDGWIPWFEDYVLSPDRKYYCSSGYLDMRDVMYGTPNVITAYEYDGSISYFSKYSDYEEYFKNLPEEELLAMELQGNDGISVTVAHMVNARTPLMTPGFRIVGSTEGRAAYHSVQMGDDLYLLDDILDIYMNGIADELIPHIKLYAFPESQEFLDSIKGNTILNAHPTPLAKDSEMLTIPEDAVCLSFERVPDGQEAPNSPNPRKPGHENLNKDAVFARYVTKDDPNFGEGVNLVFAITFDDELVYWIHMGRNFRETLPEIQWFVYALPY